MIEEVNHYSCLSFQRSFGKRLRIWIIAIAQHPTCFGEGKQEMIGGERDDSVANKQKRKERKGKT
jgi:hypothetical protein